VILHRDMEKLPTTIENLAAMINMHMASKEDIKALEERVNTRFDGVESQLGRIEDLILEEQKCEIEDLKKRVKKLEDALAV
jgi:polyhydroxyalkanoate synthesis regulator phasin